MGRDGNRKRQLKSEFKATHKSQKYEDSVLGASRLRTIIFDDHDGVSVKTTINTSSTSPSFDPTELKLPLLAPPSLHLSSSAESLVEADSEMQQNDSDDNTQVSRLEPYYYPI